MTFMTGLNYFATGVNSYLIQKEGRDKYKTGMYNAMLADAKAIEVLKKYEDAARKTRQRGEIGAGSQTNMLAASGFDLTSGAPLEFRIESANNIITDEYNMRKAGLSASMEISETAASLRRTARGDYRTGKINSVMNLFQNQNIMQSTGDLFTPFNTGGSNYPEITTNGGRPWLNAS